MGSNTLRFKEILLSIGAHSFPIEFDPSRALSRMVQGGCPAYIEVEAIP